MTDTSEFLPNSIALTSDLQYRLKPSACRSKSYRCSVLPTNKSTFGSTETCIIYVPCGRRNSYLDVLQSYMRMTVKNTSATAFNMDGSGASFISRVDVFHGSNLLETIQAYGVLSNYIFDLQTSDSQRKGLANIYGFDNTGGRQGATLAAGAQITLCLPIFSGVVGVLSEKCLPTGALGDDIRLEITFESTGNAIYSAGASTWSIQDFQLELTFIELSDEGENMVRQELSPDKPTYLHGSSWRHYASNLPVLSGNFSTLVPARFASLKQLAMIPRLNSILNNVNQYSSINRTNPNIAFYQWRMGGALIPSKSVYLENSSNTGGYGEAFTELLKSWHGLNTTDQSTILGQSYNISDQASSANFSTTQFSADANGYKNGFVISQELESFAQRNDVLLSGMNTLSSQVFFECQINTAPSASYTLSFFAWYDHILILQNGLLSVKY